MKPKKNTRKRAINIFSSPFNFCCCFINIPSPPRTWKSHLVQIVHFTHYFSLISFLSFVDLYFLRFLWKEFVHTGKHTQRAWEPVWAETEIITWSKHHHRHHFFFQRFVFKLHRLDETKHRLWLGGDDFFFSTSPGKKTEFYLSPAANKVWVKKKKTLSLLQTTRCKCKHT